MSDAAAVCAKLKAVSKLNSDLPTTLRLVILGVEFFFPPPKPK
jgi:hypothetical protein